MNRGVRVSKKTPKFFHSAWGSNPGPLGCEPSLLTVTPQSPYYYLQSKLEKKTEATFLCNNSTIEKKTVKYKITAANKEYYAKKLSDCKGNSCATWDVVKEIVPNKNSCPET